MSHSGVTCGTAACTFEHSADRLAIRLAAAPATELERPRFGLVGMQERATALGGQFAAGPTAEGWRVTCRLPLDAVRR
jgi:signal transduction histidine kinase